MLPRAQRARGELVLSVKQARGRSRISDLRVGGSLKALFPQTRETALQAVFLNTAGGITGGDRFTLNARAEAGAHLVMTSQAAERIYRAQPGETGRMMTRLDVAGGARLDWLPQETIVFDQARLQRRIDVSLAPDARFLAVEPLLLGRLAMGERVKTAHLEDQWRIRRGDRLIFADNLRLSGPIEDILARPGVAPGCRAIATLIFAAPDADLKLAPLRAALGQAGAASLVRPGLLFARAIAPDGFDLRRNLIPAIEVLSGTSLPRTWTI
ncbi:urease accessory protein UreD [Pseudooceanicola nanhaiensis]|uniref:urease accessory protein UreD n=1 Tax=Pseudooceanicola nanhaiensis TaxID=375761 RepID=UPI001CD388E0|nr:urease accessory protein UreD [Pseudooceanicola nanhaiensis]MCA0922096.1 urease accessory protein UreD [Pseudooceanicola nanhaiensis]